MTTEREEMLGQHSPATYVHQLSDDVALIDSETLHLMPDAATAERAGRYAVLAHRYAAYADYEAAQRQRLQQQINRMTVVGEICDERR